MSNFAYLLKTGGRPADAVLLYEEALAIERSFDREGHRNLAVLLNNLAAAAEDGGDLDLAESTRLEALELEQTHRPPGHWRIGSAHGAVGDLYLRNGRPAEAELHLRSRLNVYEAGLGANHEWTNGARAAVAVVAGRLGRDAEEGGLSTDVQSQLRRAAEALEEDGEEERAASYRALLATSR